MKVGVAPVAIGLIVATVGGSLLFAVRSGPSPNRCGAGLVESGPRCCGAGQRFAAGRCDGLATACGDAHDLKDGACVAPVRIVPVSGGAVDVAPLDWEAAGAVAARRAVAGPFRIDAFEVTAARWLGCVRGGACPALPDSEPGLPVSDVTAAEARGFCRFAGGDLPTTDQWIVAAAGAGARRYPWGETGAVCRRAAFGLVEGPCGFGARGPDLAGAHPDGVTPDGVHDLAGNVAEWTVLPDGTFEVRGGAYLDAAAASLRTWHGRAARPEQRSPAIGLRCAYPP